MPDRFSWRRSLLACLSPRRAIRDEPLDQRVTRWIVEARQRGAGRQEVIAGVEDLLVSFATTSGPGDPGRRRPSRRLPHRPAYEPPHWRWAAALALVIASLGLAILMWLVMRSL